MGLKWRGVLRCGACGQPRGFGSHLCKPGKRKRRRTSLQRPVTWDCSSCHKPRGLRHTCHVQTDFKARKRAAERKRKRDLASAKKRRQAEKRREARKAATARRAARRKQAAAERRARERARKAEARNRPPRPRSPGHEPGSCGDRDCPKYGCKAYFQGIEDCPLPHGEGG